jgi:hypothetical protein
VLSKKRPSHTASQMRLEVYPTTCAWLDHPPMGDSGGAAHVLLTLGFSSPFLLQWVARTMLRYFDASYCGARNPKILMAAFIVDIAGSHILRLPP